MSPAGRYPNFMTGVTMVFLCGLPYSASARDILAFLEGFPSLSEENVHIKHNADSRTKGEAPVAFPMRAEVERAVREKHRRHMGRHHIEVFIRVFM